MQLVAWGKVNWIDSMAISKWLNILALHLLEIQKHSSFPTSFLIRRCPLSFTLTLWIWLIPLALTSDEFRWKSGARLILFYQVRGNRGFSTLQHCFSITFQKHCPGKGNIYFCACRSSSWAMGVCAPGTHWAWLPSENRQLAAGRDLLIQFTVSTHE